MLCSESELNLSDESEGDYRIIFKIRKNWREIFSKSKLKSNLIDLSITPNRPDCFGIRGIARDLSASGFGKLIDQKKKI